MKKRLGFLVVVTLIMSLILTGCGGGADKPKAEEKKQRVTFASSGQGGTFYVAASAIAALVNSEVANLEVTAEVTKGVVENVRLMASKQTDMGFSYGSTAYQAIRGEGDFANNKYEGLRAVANIHDGAMNFVTLKKTGIKTLTDLQGKKVSIGPKGSGSASVAEDFLKVVGLFDKINISYLSFDDSTASLRDGHLDAMIIGGTTPVPTLIELEANLEVVFLPIDDATRKTYLDARPYHVEYTIPAGGYKSVKEPIKTIGYTVIWVAREDIPEQVIYNMLKSMMSDAGKAQLASTQAAFKEMSPGIERFEKINLKLHPGAQKYYSEIKK